MSNRSLTRTNFPSGVHCPPPYDGAALGMSCSSSKNFSLSFDVRFVFLPSGTEIVNQSLLSKPSRCLPLGARLTPDPDAVRSGFFSPVRTFTSE